MMKRRNLDCGGKLRRPFPAKPRNKISEGFYGSTTFLYLKFLSVWALVLLADFMLEFRFEYLWPFWLLLRSVYDSFKYQGLAFSVFFVFIAFTSDMICFVFIPVHWLFFAASTYVWVQYVWHTDRGVCLPTVSLWLLFVYIEASVRLKELKNLPFHLDLCRPFAAHCIGYPVVTLGFGFKSYISYKLRLRKQKEVQKENEFYMELLAKALPPDCPPPTTCPPLPGSNIPNGTEVTNGGPISNGVLVPASSSNTASHGSSCQANCHHNNHNHQNSNAHPLQTNVHSNSHSTSHNNQSHHHNHSRQKSSTHNSLSSASGERDRDRDRSTSVASSTGAHANVETNAAFSSSSSSNVNSISNGVANGGTNLAKGSNYTSNVDYEPSVKKAPSGIDKNDLQYVENQLAKKISNYLQPIDYDSVENADHSETSEKSALKNSYDNHHNGLSNGLSGTNNGGVKSSSSSNSASNNSSRSNKEYQQTSGSVVNSLNSSNSNSCSNQSSGVNHNQHSNSSKKTKNNVMPNNMVTSQDKGLKDDHVTRLEADIKRLKGDLQASRQTEHELRAQIATLLVNEKNQKNELKQLQEDNDNLQQKLHNLVTARQQDKQTISSLEKKVADLQKQKQSAENALDKEKKNKKQEQDAACARATAVAMATRPECGDSCKTRKREMDSELKQLRRELKIREDQLRQAEREAHTLRQYKESQGDTEVLMSALSAMQDKNTHLENSLSAETRLKLDLFSALGETKRQLELSRVHLEQKDKEIDELKSKIAEVMAVMPTASSYSALDSGLCSFSFNGKFLQESSTPPGVVTSSSSDGHHRSHCSTPMGRDGRHPLGHESSSNQKSSLDPNACIYQPKTVMPSDL